MNEDMENLRYELLLDYLLDKLNEFYNKLMELNNGVEIPPERLEILNA